ncbi:MAG: outer membrane protein assembly factor BamB [Gammaproteobacteria bacterium]|nr:outer membrane protein assembly factor BamB [Gammaproteobacteria bacterium]
MNVIRTSLITLLLLSIAACGGKSKKTEFFGAEEKPKKPKVTTTTKLTKVWRTGLGDSLEPGDSIISPALLGAHLYAAAPNGRVEKLSADSGKRVWQTKLKKERISAGVGVGSGLVLVGTDQGVLYALNQSDGSVAWSQQLSTEILASPVVDNNIVVARAGDGKVYGMAAFDGRIIWTISRQLPKLTLRGDSRPLLFGGVVFTGFSDGTLAAIAAANGRALWDFPISFPRGTSEIDRLADIDTNPLLVGDFIYVSSYQEVTHALNIQEQRILWSADVSSFHSIAYDAAHLYISDKQGVVHQVDRSSGAKTWSQTGLRLFSVSAPISYGRYVLVADGKGTLYVLSKEDGRYLGKHRLGADTIVGEPIVENGVVYILDSGGNLQAFSISDKAA